MSKISRYNIFIEQKEAVIIYNTLWNSFLITGKRNANLIQKGIFEASYYKNERLFNALVEKKIIIDSTVDEIEIIRKILYQTNSDPAYFEIIINPTLACNFRCWYCYEPHHKTSVIGREDLKGILMLIQNTIEKKKLTTFVIKFFGGEPLLCYDKVIIPIVKQVRDSIKLKPINISIGITTNGYLLSRERLLFLVQNNVCNLQITIDGNKERHNCVRFSKTERDSYSRIVENIHCALSVGINVCLRLNLSEETGLDVQELLKDFSDLTPEERNLLVFSVHKVWQAEVSLYDTIEKIVIEIRDSGYKCASYFTNPSSIWSTCYADKLNHLTINPKGDIFKCTACDFSKDHIEGNLKSDGTIIWNTLHRKRIQATPLNFQSCIECSILPICVGGCSQRLIENEGESDCPLGMNLLEKQKYAYRILSEKIERL